MRAAQKQLSSGRLWLFSPRKAEGRQLSRRHQQHRQDVSDVLRHTAVDDQQVVGGVKGDGRAQQTAGASDLQPRPLPGIRQPFADDAAAPLHALRPDATDASWALRWVGSHKNVHVILSGMSAEDQLTDNLATFGHFEPLSPAENAAVESVANELHRRIKIGCTGCRDCMPCPLGGDIPDNFSIWNKLGMFGQKDAIKAQWTTCFPDSEKALHCVRCGKCEAVCPQKLPIRDSLAQLQKELDAL